MEDWSVYLPHARRVNQKAHRVLDHSTFRRLESRRCRANKTHIRQSRPNSGLSSQVKDLQTLQVLPSSLGDGRRRRSSSASRTRPRERREGEGSEGWQTIRKSTCWIHSANLSTLGRERAELVRRDRCRRCTSAHQSRRRRGRGGK